MNKLLFLTLILAMCSIACNNPKRTSATAEPITEQQPTTNIAIGDNSQNALDWAGAYEGILPCADCEGILTKIVLNNNNTYTKTDTYLGVKNNKNTFEEEGDFTWNSTGAIITLTKKKDAEDDTAQSTASQYKVGENKLIALDINGKEVTGSLADKYILTKK